LLNGFDEVADMVWWLQVQPRTTALECRIAAPRQRVMSVGVRPAKVLSVFVFFLLFEKKSVLVLPLTSD